MLRAAKSYRVNRRGLNLSCSLSMVVCFFFSARKSRQASLFFAKVRKWPRFNAEMMPELPLHDRYKVREALTALLKSHIKQVILFCDQKDLPEIMNEVM